MGRPDYIICLECESEVDQFSWREGEVRKAVCDVCGNNDPDAFSLPEDFESAKQALLTDPQTSGGLLVACAPDAVGGVLAAFHADGFDRAAIIGNVAAGTPRVVVR